MAWSLVIQAWFDPLVTCLDTTPIALASKCQQLSERDCSHQQSLRGYQAQRRHVFLLARGHLRQGLEFGREQSQKRIFRDDSLRRWAVREDHSFHPGGWGSRTQQNYSSLRYEGLDSKDVAASVREGVRNRSSYLQGLKILPDRSSKIRSRPTAASFFLIDCLVTSIRCLFRKHQDLQHQEANSAR